jgi:thiol-disulfide isomerase/thioredoxin
LLERESIISKIFQILSKPFEGYPGYWKQLDDFDIMLTCIEPNKEFPTEAFSLKELKGNVVILFFTTTWCPNCVKVFQDLDNLSRKLSDKKLSNVKIITVVLGMDDDDTVKNYFETNKITSLRKFKSVSPLFFNTIRAVPTCFVLNKESTPVWGFSGIANYGSLEFLNFIEDLSKEEKK